MRASLAPGNPTHPRPRQIRIDRQRFMRDSYHQWDRSSGGRRMKVQQAVESTASVGSRPGAPLAAEKLTALSVIKVGIGSLGFMAVALILSLLH